MDSKNYNYKHHPIPKYLRSSANMLAERMRERLFLIAKGRGLADKQISNICDIAKAAYLEGFSDGVFIVNKLNYEYRENHSQTAQRPCTSPDDK